MMLFGEKDLKNLRSFLDGQAQANIVSRLGGFTDEEASLLAEAFLGKDYATNILLLEPEQSKKTVSVEQVRNLNNLLSLTARDGNERRLVVVNSILGASAQNAFLKMIEEPPNGVFFLLLGSREDDYLPTIQSRCQLIKLNGPSDKEALSYILKQSSYSDAEASILLLQSGRIVPNILKNLSDEKLRKDNLAVLSDAKKFLSESDYGKLRVIKPYSANKDAAREFLRSLMIVIELAARSGPKEALKLSGISSKVEATMSQIESNANVRLSLVRLVV